MSFTRIVTGCGLLAVAGFPAAFAQERAAASALGTQMTWSALADQVKAASNRVTILDDQMKKSIICNKRFMAYAPGAAGADGDGCIENQLIKQLAKRMDDLDKAVADINTRLTSVEGKVTKIEGDIATLTKKMADLTKRMDIAEADITKLEERMKTVEGKVAALDTALKTEVADRKAGDKTLDARITKEVDDINKDIAALEKELKARIVSVESEVDLILKCGRSGMVYNDKTKKCLAAGTEPTIKIFEAPHRHPINGDKELSGLWSACFISNFGTGADQYTGGVQDRTTTVKSSSCGTYPVDAYPDLTMFKLNTPKNFSMDAPQKWAAYQSLNTTGCSVICVRF